MRETREAGFTLVEILVAFALFAVLSISFYAVVFAAVKGSGTSRSVARVSEEARLGLNRMVRDTREAERIVDQDSSTPGVESYTIRVDFNRDGDADDGGETEEFVFTESTGEITLNGDLLVRGVEKISSSTPVFSFSSNLLEFDDDASGVAEMDELPSADIYSYLTNVSFALAVTDDDQRTIFRTEAQLRNRR